MKKIIWFFGFLPFVCSAQLEQGIKFETELKSWKEVLKTAKAQKKYIFIDCYTTWCVPCKIMDKEVYSSKVVGDYYNSKYLNVKIQMDRTDKDDEYTRNWYGDAEFIQKSFSVNAYPTFLFLDSEGKPLHKATGLLNPQQFAALAKEAQDPQKQYYKILTGFKPGVMDTAEMRGIARSLKYSGSELANKIVEDYLNRVSGLALFANDNLKLLRDFKEVQKAQEVAIKYIESLPTEKLFTEYNLEFTRDFIQNTQSTPFKIFYSNPEKINRIMKNNDYVQSTIAWIISKEEFFNPIGIPSREAVKRGVIVQSPDWLSIGAKIKSKYNQYYSQRVLMDLKVWWYTLTRNWQEYSKAQINKMDAVYSKKDLTNGGVCRDLNNDCFSVFLRATDTAILKRAIYWMEELFKHYLTGATFSTYMDTYANLLYKVGDKKLALVWQERAVLLDPLDKGNADNLKKMKNNEPTWPLPESYKDRH